MTYEIGKMVNATGPQFRIYIAADSHEVSIIACGCVRDVRFLQTILLQEKSGVQFCVSCRDLDSDVDKDNPGEKILMKTLSFIHSKVPSVCTPPPSERSRTIPTPPSVRSPASVPLHPQRGLTASPLHPQRGLAPSPPHLQ